ncbi:MAG: alpha/beta hydrolase [Dongiaceae bacterium]
MVPHGPGPHATQNAAGEVPGTRRRRFLLEGAVTIVPGIAILAARAAATLAAGLHVGCLLLLSGLVGLIAMFRAARLPAIRWTRVTADRITCAADMIWSMPATRFPTAIALAGLLGLAGCTGTHPMMPTPSLYTGAQAKPLFTEETAALRTPPLDLLYITDRAPAQGPDQPEPYTSERSRSEAFGSTTVLFGEGMTWDALAKQSLEPERTPSIDLTLGPTREIGRFPPIPYGLAVTGAGLTRAPAVVDAHEAATRALQAEVARRLAASPRKEVVLFVHGVDNTFQDAALTMGELCHFLGREFVCGIFTWPAAGTRGVLFGYEEDYESSLFAVEHLRKTIRAIAGTPGLQKIHLIAHSRGTDILLAALSDLNVEAYMQQTTIAQRFKVANVVLMAPDLDPDVAVAKVFKVWSDPDIPYGPAPNPRVVLETQQVHTTLYVSPEDKALATSGWLFGSLVRLGRMEKGSFTPDQLEHLRAIGFVDVIEVQGKTDLIGHSYFVTNPEVSSDLVALLRYGLGPDDPGRALEPDEKPFWRIPAKGASGAAH